MLGHMAITSYKSLLTGQIVLMEKKKKKTRDQLARKKDGMAITWALSQVCH